MNEVPLLHIQMNCEIELLANSCQSSLNFVDEIIDALNIANLEF